MSDDQLESAAARNAYEAAHATDHVTESEAHGGQVAQDALNAATAPAASAASTDVFDDLDDVLDDIANVLDTDAQAYVDSFVQKGGE